MNYQEHIKNNNLRNYRIATGLRQKDIAALFGFKLEDRISHWENGTAVPSIVNLFRLSAMYGKLPHELYPELFEHIAAEINARITNTIP